MVLNRRESFGSILGLATLPLIKKESAFPNEEIIFLTKEMSYYIFVCPSLCDLVYPYKTSRSRIGVNVILENNDPHEEYLEKIHERINMSEWSKVQHFIYEEKYKVEIEGQIRTHISRANGSLIYVDDTPFHIHDINLIRKHLKS